MVGISAAITAAVSGWFGSDITETVTYNGTDIPAHVEYKEAPDRAGGASVRTAYLHVRKSDVPDPAYRDTAVIGSDTWLVHGIISGDADHVWVIEIHRDERPVI